MNDKLKEILSKYDEFKSYVSNIDLSIFEKCSRTELKCFYEQIKNVNDVPYISNVINDILKKKKEEEFPQLLGVHHYPEINQISCLTNYEKISLDAYLGNFKLNGLIYTK